ncbi:MAG TPA: hypothetical protein VLV86_15850 [Vicinamibacterales bacterium]|nr:hypothetical protein [Vicinamibacterales bacterium]
MICTVINERQSPLGKECAQFTPSAVEQRTNDSSVPRVHARQPARTRTAQKSKEKRLGLIVAGMAHRDRVSGEMPARSTEEFVARSPRSTLDRMSFAPRALRDGLTFDKEGPAQLLSHRSAERFVATSVLPQLMIEMRDPHDRQLTGVLQHPQQMRERD